MTAESISNPSGIEPYLNPAYWDGQYIGNGETTPWPSTQTKFLEQALALKFLRQYINQKAPLFALARLQAGETFKASDYPTGSVLVTMAESIRQDSPQDAVSMSQFAEVALPEHRTAIVDGERELIGHGYLYHARPLVNVISGLGSNPNVYVVSREDAIRPGVTDRELAPMFDPGVREFTVGQTYHFGEGDSDIIIRVNELILCMGGAKSKGESRRVEAPGIAPNLATEGA